MRAIPGMNKRASLEGSSEGVAMRRYILVCACAIAFLCGCELFEKQRTPIGYSRDENGRQCATYENKKDVVYETRCDYGEVFHPPVTNPLSRQKPTH